MKKLKDRDQLDNPALVKYVQKSIETVVGKDSLARQHWDDLCQDQPCQLDVKKIDFHRDQVHQLTSSTAKLEEIKVHEF